jgi:hypothetical protein
MDLAEQIRRAWMKFRGKDPDFIAIVLLLREFRLPTEDVLKAAAGRAWGIDWANPGPKTSVVVGKKSRIVAVRGHALNVVGAPRPYINEPKEFAELQPDPRVREVVVEHRAWMSVDYLVGSKNRRTMTERYCVAAKLVAELIDENCIGLCVPEEDVIAPAPASLADRLRGLRSVKELKGISI